MNYHALVQSITALHAESVGRAASAVNQALVLRNWVIGAHIVEFEQNGEDRAEYGGGLLRRLSSDLSACGIKGVSPDMLERMRLFSRHYPQLAGSISAPPVRISTALAADAYEVEFCDDEGRAYASTALKADQLMVLYYRPQIAA